MTQHLLLLRHGEVTSHHGDVPVTDDGLRTAVTVGRSLATKAAGRTLRIVSGETRRTRDTATALAQGAREAGADVVEAGVAFALRNPDLYLGGVRVDMVSSAQAYADQVPGMTPAEVTAVAFYRDWLRVPDPIGWWVAHRSAPGDDAADVANRVERFAASLRDGAADALTVGVTHSPVLRACAVRAVGEDPGEPAWLAGVTVAVADDGAVRFEVLTQAP